MDIVRSLLTSLQAGEGPEPGPLVAELRQINAYILESDGRERYRPPSPVFHLVSAAISHPNLGVVDAGLHLGADAISRLRWAPSAAGVDTMPTLREVEAVSALLTDCVACVGVDYLRPACCLCFTAAASRHGFAMVSDVVLRTCVASDDVRQEALPLVSKSYFVCSDGCPPMHPLVG